MIVSKRVLLTGGSGKAGKHVARYLIKKGYRVLNGDLVNNAQIGLDFLYLDVNNDRIGIKKSNPSYELDINGTAQATNLIATNSATTGNLTFQGNTISSTLGTIELTPSGGDPVIYHSRIQVDSIEMNDNTIKTIDSNASLELNPQGTGTIELIGNTLRGS